MYEEFIQIYDNYKNDIYRLALSYTQNIQDSEDIVQNVYIKLYKNFNKLDKSNIKHWLVKVTINECKNLVMSSWYKKIKYITDKEENTIGYIDADNKDFWHQLNRLSKKSRMILHLYYYENYQIKEIAKMLHMTETNTKTKLFRARKELKKILKEDEL